MKIRTGFVSNSSSSSFCLIGTSDEATIREWAQITGLITKLKKEHGADEDEDDVYFGFGHEEKSGITFAGESLNYAQFAGLPAEPLLEKYPLPKAKEEARKKIAAILGKKIQDMPILKFEFGEAGSG